MLVLGKLAHFGIHQSAGLAWTYKLERRRTHALVYLLDGGIALGWSLGIGGLLVGFLPGEVLGYEWILWISLIVYPCILFSTIRERRKIPAPDYALIQTDGPAIEAEQWTLARRTPTTPEQAAAHDPGGECDSEPLS